MCTPVYVKWPAFPPDQECRDQMSLVIENQGMFSLETEERPHSVTLDMQKVEEYVIERIHRRIHTNNS